MTLRHPLQLLVVTLRLPYYQIGARFPFFIGHIKPIFLPGFPINCANDLYMGGHGMKVNK